LRYHRYPGAIGLPAATLITGRVHGDGFNQPRDSDGDGVIDCHDQCWGVDDAIFAPGCETAIPTISEWGLVILALLLLAAGKVYFGRRAATS
jgi:hypothetical protein